MGKKINELLPILALSLIPTFLLWIPFILRLGTFWTIPLSTQGMATIISNYDGPLYIVVAKTFYGATAIKENFSFDLPVEYYAAHFPLYPVLIRFLAPLTGYLYSSLTVTTFLSFIALCYFYSLAKKLDKKHALWLTAIFAIFPARWLIVRSVPSPEPIFVATILASMYYFNQKKYWLAGIAGALAQLTKSPGALLFIAYGMSLLAPQVKKLEIKKILKAYPLILIPLSLIGLFVYYGQVYGNFFAYFGSGDNIHLFFPPFQIFNFSAPWVGTFWLEEIIFVYMFAFLGIIKLFKDKSTQTEAWFSTIFFLSIIFVSHRDVLRYSLPVVPFIILSFRNTLIKKEFKYTLAFLAIPIFLYSLAFISQNTMPISDWTPFL